MTALVDGRTHFEIPDEITYLNTAYMSPWLRSSREALKIGLSREAEPWNLVPDHFFTPVEQLRSAFAALIDASADDVAIVPSASYGVATAAQALPLSSGQNIVVAQYQYPSNYYSWQARARAAGAQMRAATPDGPGGLSTAVLDAIDRETAIVTVPHCHWMSGEVIDLEAVSKKARSVGAAFAVDGSQSIGAMPLSVASLDPDFVFTCGYKWLLCPYTISFLYAAPRHHDATPLEGNPLTRARAWEFANLADYRDEHQPGARRFDTGERACFALLPAALAALRQLDTWTVPAIAATINARIEEIEERAKTLGFELLSRSVRAPHFGALRAPSSLPKTLAGDLRDRNIYVSVRGEWIRVTPHVFTSEGDIDRLMSALEALT